VRQTCFKGSIKKLSSEGNFGGLDLKLYAKSMDNVVAVLLMLVTPSW
jgi:hypothetical protein